MDTGLIVGVIFFALLGYAIWRQVAENMTIQCPECGKRIKQKARRCPYCGHQSAQHRPSA